MRHFLAIFIMFFVMTSCGGGDNTGTQDSTLSELEECAQNVPESDEDITTCQQFGELPDGYVLNDTVFENGLTFYPNGMFDQRFDNCRLSGDYVYTDNGLGDICFCVVYSVLPEIVNCGINGRNNQARCNRCFTADSDEHGDYQLPVEASSLENAYTGILFNGKER